MQGQGKEKQQMTDEELQRTQVLNFEDFKQTTRYEKISSKKPAIIVALIGVLAIVIGGGYPVLQSQMSKRADVATSQVQARKTTKKIKSKLTCTKTKPVEKGKTGLVELIEINYQFEDDELVSFTKDLTLKSTTPEEVQKIQAYLTALQPYLVQKPGYDISVKQIDGGVITTTAVEYSKLDVSSIPDLNQKNDFFNVIYVANTKKNDVAKDMATQEYTCN